MRSFSFHVAVSLRVVIVTLTQKCVGLDRVELTERPQLVCLDTQPVLVCSSSLHGRPFLLPGSRSVVPPPPFGVVKGLLFSHSFPGPPFDTRSDTAAAAKVTLIYLPAAVTGP